jgi:glutamate-1-semialdehyde 2,1-aminomutase
MSIVEKNSALLFERAKRVIPGGVNSPVRACKAVGRIPRFISRACGDRIFDVDGNEYIDYVSSWGPGILAHAHPEVVEAVVKAARDGLTYGAPTKREVEMAELVRELVPSMEVTRMVSSGTEAVMSALRVARGFTGRDGILKFDGCYHGHSDGMLVRAGSGILTHASPGCAGVPNDFAKHTFCVPYNDTEAVERVFETSGKDIAAVIVEPVAANQGVILPKPGFLRFLREITNKYGALLIFDEVITGFRLGLSGAQGPVKTLWEEPVIPDLTTLGKIVGGGMPAAIYGGREEIMRHVSPDGPVYQAGTLSGNPIATAAGLTTLKILKRDPGIYARLEQKTATLSDVIRSAFGEKVKVTNVASLLGVMFKAGERCGKATSSEMFAMWYSQLLERGIYVAPSCYEAMFVSDAHSNEDISATIKAIEETAAVMLDPLA